MSVLINDKQAKIFEILKSGSGLSVSEIAKASGFTYVHACNFIIGCERSGLFRSEKRGKSKFVFLTDKGMAVADLLIKANVLLQER